MNTCYQLCLRWLFRVLLFWYICLETDCPGSITQAFKHVSLNTSAKQAVKNIEDNWD